MVDLVCTYIWVILVVDLVCSYIFVLTFGSYVWLT